MSAEAQRRFARTLIAAAAPILVVSVLVIPGGASAATIVRVPEDFSTIQAAVDAASDGDVIDIASGTYAENVTITKPLTLRGRVYDAMDPRRNATILDGRGLSVLTIPAGVSPGPRLIGLAIENGDDGVAAESPFKIEQSYLLGNQDALDYGPGAGGLCMNNVFVRSADDALDFDHLVNDVRVEGNRMLHTGDDGIEIRLHDDVIPETAELLVRDNEIAGSAEDGIQIIDYLQKTNRRIVVRGNLIRNTAMAGIGLMSDGNTKEDFSGASVRERVHVFGNTFVDNDRGISGGNNLIALNNIFQGQGLALKDVDATSIASYNLFWNNGINARHSDVDRASMIHADPLLDADFQLGAGSQAVDAGAAYFEWRGEVVLDRPATSYQGTAPDLGWYERRQ